MKFSVLDYGLLDEGQTVEQAWQATVQLARLADELGFHRFWLAEHHNVHALTISSPEVMIAYLAGQTQRIRLGSGGIMSLHYSPYKIAELATSLETLCRGRLDLGLGNSTGTAVVKEHLQSLYQPSQFEAWLGRFQAYLTGQDQSIHLVPRPLGLSQVFTLGMGGQSMSLSAKLGLGYVYGSFPYIDQAPLAVAGELARSYRRDFQPSEHLNKPHFILALFVVVAETGQEAEDLAKSLDIWMLGKSDFNDFSHFPSLATYQAYELTEAEKERIAQQRRRMIVGDLAAVQAQLEPFIEACQPDEIMFIPLVPGLSQREKALKLLAEMIESE